MVVSSGSKGTDALETQVWDGAPAVAARLPEIIDLDTPEKRVKSEAVLELADPESQLAEPVSSIPGEADPSQLAEPASSIPTEADPSPLAKPSLIDPQPNGSRSWPACRASLIDPQSHGARVAAHSRASQSCEHAFPRANSETQTS